MKDGYLDFANSNMGAKLVNALGLPKPMPLERHQPGQPVIKGSVLIGGGGEPQLLEALAGVFQRIGAQTLAHERLHDRAVPEVALGRVRAGGYLGARARRVRARYHGPHVEPVDGGKARGGGGRVRGVRARKRAEGRVPVLDADEPVGGGVAESGRRGV